MIIVVATMEVDPADRERYLDSKRDQAAATRLEHGCLDYAFSSDADDPGTVRLIERWERMDDLEAHLATLSAAPAPDEEPVPVHGGEAVVYEADVITPPWG
jgi:quinol monooxygenase YgiN